ncbi:hypothetical protein [Kitasatospora sp. NPDC093806]|uniref:hypothetical protein n=1 Tax=Kitasatospora sp. NPDC093806 TaxID=3155075 RepID=UPI00341D0BC3
MSQTSPRKDDAEVTFEQVTVLSFDGHGGRVDEQGRVLLIDEPADVTRIPVRIVREGMTIKRVAGYWISWSEWFGPDDIRNHGRWVPEEEYVRPYEGGVDGRLDVKVSAYWAVEREPQRARIRTSDAVVTFRPGETLRELVLERPEPHHPATLVVHLTDAWWAGGPGGGQVIHYGFAGALEEDGAASGGEADGEPVHRFAECATGHLRAVAVR